MKTQIGILSFALVLGGGVAYAELHKTKAAPLPTPTSPTSTSAPLQSTIPAQTPTAIATPTPKKRSIGVQPPSITGGGEVREGGEGGEVREHEGGGDD